jgi:T5SS/PEP-CTERM-associated repeat protein
MIISNGGVVVGSFSIVGGSSGSSNTMLVTGPGSAWISTSLYVGNNTLSNRVTISDGGAVSASLLSISPNLNVPFGNNNDNVVQVTGGSLVVSGGGLGQLIVGEVGGKGSLILSNGSVTADRLLVTNGANSVFTFDAGTLTSGSTTVSNTQLFVVGDGTDAATFQIHGGVHKFANNLEIRSNAVVIGCGTINGDVTIDPGGTLLASCGTLTVTGIITNNGVLQASAGRVVEAFGAVVNNGTIDLVGGSTMFHSSFTNNGIVLATLEVVGIAKAGKDIRITWTSPLGQTNELQATTGGPGGIYSSNNFSAVFAVTNAVNPTTNFLDVGAVTNFTSRYYRLRLVP